MAEFAVDIDDTLYSFSDIAREKYLEYALSSGNNNAKQGAYTPWMDWRAPADFIGPKQWYEIIKKCHADDVIRSRTPLVGSVDTLIDLVKNGHDLTYITGRDETAFEATEDWLLDNHFPKGILHCVHGDKKSYAAGCKYMIDDRPRNLIEFVYEKNWKTHLYGERKGFGLLKEYNANLTDVRGIYLSPSWAGIKYALKKELLI